ncbi:MAG: M48 family metalloprotease, partial [Planctomycetaceae bacterium]|nr:M48 family metalloprotease [Planctomycetaceae bacterium]
VEVSVPVVIGIVRPVILIPAGAATGLSEDQLLAVIAHELAHIRRYDLLVNLLQRVIEALLFFHPVVWWLSHRISQEREHACDDLVLAAGYPRARYADALLRMAELASDRRWRTTAESATALAVDGSSGSELKKRILRVLASPQNPQLRPGQSALVAVFVVALASVCIPVGWNQLQPVLADETVPVSGEPDPATTRISEDADEQASGKTSSATQSPAGDNERFDKTAYSDTDERMREYSTAGHSIVPVISPNGRWLAVRNGNPSRTMYSDGRSDVGTWRPTVDIIDTESGQTQTTINLSRIPADSDRPVDQGPTFIEATDVAFSPDSQTLAVGTSAGHLWLFDVKTGKFLRALDDREGRVAGQKTPEFRRQQERVLGSVKSVAFSPDGKQLAVCGDSFSDWEKSLDRVERLGLEVTGPGRLKVFDLGTGQVKYNPVAHSDMAVDVEYSPDGRYLASAGRWMDGPQRSGFGNGVILWNAATGEKVARIDLDLRGWIYEIRFSPDSSRMLVGAQDFDSGGGNGTGVAAMLNTATLSVLWKRTVTGSAMNVAFYLHEDAVIVLSDRQSLQYLEADSGRTLALLTMIDKQAENKPLCTGFDISSQGHLLISGIVEKGNGRLHVLRVGKLKDESEDVDPDEAIDTLPMGECYRLIKECDESGDVRHAAQLRESLAARLKRITQQPAAAFLRDVEEPADDQEVRGGPFVGVQTELDGVWSNGRGNAGDWTDWITRRQQRYGADRLKLLSEAARGFRAVEAPQDAVRVLQEALTEFTFCAAEPADLLKKHWPVTNGDPAKALGEGVNASLGEGSKASMLIVLLTELSSAQQAAGEIDHAISTHWRLTLASFMLSWNKPDAAPTKHARELWAMIRSGHPTSLPLFWFNVTDPEHPTHTFDLTGAGEKGCPLSYHHANICAAAGFNFAELQVTADLKGHDGLLSVYRINSDGRVESIGSLKPEAEGPEEQTVTAVILPPPGVGMVQFQIAGREFRAGKVTVTASLSDHVGG